MSESSDVMTPLKAMEIISSYGTVVSAMQLEKARSFLAGIKYERQAAKGLVEALEFIRSKNGLQYGAIFSTCDKALFTYKIRTEGK